MSLPLDDIRAVMRAAVDGGYDFGPLIESLADCLRAFDALPTEVRHALTQTDWGPDHPDYDEMGQ